MDLNLAPWSSDPATELGFFKSFVNDSVRHMSRSWILSLDFLEKMTHFIKVQEVREFEGGGGDLSDESNHIFWIRAHRPIHGSCILGCSKTLILSK